MPLPQKLNVQKAIRQKLSGMSYPEIAKAQGVGTSTVHQTVAPILRALVDKDTVDVYREKQAEILDAIAAKTIASITDEDMQKASLLQKSTTICQMIDKSRLVQGQSQQNISILFSHAMSGANCQEIVSQDIDETD